MPCPQLKLYINYFYQNERQARISHDHNVAVYILHKNYMNIYFIFFAI
jgi:hypothetical protein